MKKYINATGKGFVRLPHWLKTVLLLAIVALAPSCKKKDKCYECYDINMQYIGSVCGKDEGEAKAQFEKNTQQTLTMEQFKNSCKEK